MSSETIRKPHPDAIATIYGWALPKTGELLVARRGLPNPVEGYRPNRPFKVEAVETAVKSAEEPNTPAITPEPGIPPENELPVPTTPEDLNKLLGAEETRKGPGRPAGVKDSEPRAPYKRKAKTSAAE